MPLCQEVLSSGRKRASRGESRLCGRCRRGAASPHPASSSWYPITAHVHPAHRNDGFQGLVSTNFHKMDKGLRQFMQSRRGLEPQAQNRDQWQRCDGVVTPQTAARQASLSFTISRSLLRSMSIESVMPSNHLILCHPLLLLPSVFPSIRVSSSESAVRIRWPKYRSFSFNISPSSEYSGSVPFRMDWLDLLAGQGTLKSLL